ncbi:glycosyltransferase [Candidatus Saccharibacteria bacterium]|nr:glycosyltransferase [Candidatus Saccharibacteria bacterium]
MLKQKPTENLQNSANRIEKQLTSPTVTLILTFATIGAFVYLSYLIQPAYRGDPLPYTLALVAEIFIITQGLLSFWTILSGRTNPRNYEYHSAQAKLYDASVGKTAISILKKQDSIVSRIVPMYVHNKPIKVDVFIPVYGEPIEEIRATAIAARNIYGKHQTYILDDGSSDVVEEMAKKVGVEYIRRPLHNNAKAGNINYASAVTTGDFYLILDADFVAEPTILYETIPFFENDNLAFVQTPQFYDNQNNFVSTAANFMQNVFYSLIQSGKNRFNAAFCVGTNVVFRRKAVESIGGMYTKSKSEDIWTSLHLHEQGYDSVYIPTVLAVGKTPETIMAYSKQQLRWATGSFEIFLRSNPLTRRRLTVDQRLQYFATTSYYFIGFSSLLLLLLPPLQIFFNLSPIATTIPIWQWALMYSGFYLSQLVLAFYTMGGFKFKTLMLSVVSFPIYIKAFFNALTRRDQAWHATNTVSYDSPFNYVRIQVYVFVFLLLTSVVGTIKALYVDEFSISLLWNALNTFVFGYFVLMAYSEGRLLRKQRRQQRKDKKSSGNIAITQGVSS